jgi:acyl-CoA thioester hydrolase
MTTINWHKTNIRVRYKDTDRMGVVYYGNYLTFFEIGRAELMRDLGLPYSEMEKGGLNLVVTEASAKYYSNVRYDAVITIKTTISTLSKVRIRFDYEIISDKKKLIVKGHTVHACLNSDQTPTKLPHDMKKILETQIDCT